MNRTALFCTTIGALALLGSAALLTAGPLNPPPGAVAPSYKTLIEVEPRIAISTANTPPGANSTFRIRRPGSYYLTEDIIGEIGEHGIEIASSGVTLDLNGFDLLGTPGMGPVDAITASTSGLVNITILNGSIRGWGGDGIDLLTSGAIHSRIDAVQSTGNAGNGIAVAASTIVTNCLIGNNTQQGLITQRDCTVSRCIARANTGSGIVVGSGSTLSDGVASFNGADGIDTGIGCTITACSSSNNTGNGFSPSQSCTLTACSATSNAAHGFFAGNGCNVVACSSTSNAFNGIFAAPSCTIADCTISLNAFDGITVQSGSLVRGNTCSSNGNAGDGAAIHATSIDNRIEGNNCIGPGHDRGIDVDAAGNIILRNTVSGATVNFDVVSGNIILVVNATTAGTVNGASGGTAPGSTDPSANFSY
jgi:parallel beta-helix repeat protein